MIGQHVRIETNELLSGWLHHLAEINSVGDNRFSKYLFGTQYYRPQRGRAFNYERFLPAIIDRLGEDKAPGLSEMLREHMSFTEGFPFSCSARQAELIGRYIVPSSSSDAFLFPLGDGPFKPKVCPVCAHEDIERHGRIILHTEHHLDGIVSCYKHHVRLIQTNGYPTIDDITATETIDEEIARVDDFAVEMFRHGWGYTSDVLRNAMKAYADAEGASDVFALIDSYEDKNGDKKTFKHWLASGVDVLAPRKLIEFLTRIFNQYDNLAGYIVTNLDESQLLDIQVQDCEVKSYDGFLAITRCTQCGREIALPPSLLRVGVGCSCRHDNMSKEDILSDVIKTYTPDYELDRYTSRNAVYVRHIPCGDSRKTNISAVLAGKFYCPCTESAEKRIGEQNRNSMGLLMTIIRYGSSKDLDVQFENGTVIHHRTYTEFKGGQIGLPFRFSEKFVGQQSVNADGNIMRIVGYYGWKHCVVSFEDGSKTVCTTEQFKNGRVVKPQTNQLDNGAILIPLYSERLLETNISNEGLTMTLIGFRSDTNVDVALETGEIITCVTYKDFQTGRVYSKKNKIDKHYMEDRKAISRCGQTMTILRYRSSTDIDVRFDDGTILQHVSYREFINGTLLPDHTLNVKKADRVGMKVMSIVTNQMMEITEYFSVDNITVRFETGDIYYKKSYSMFTRGKIGNPEYIKRSRLHERKPNKYNEMMEIIRYGGSQDIDVRFEDGTVLTHQQYGHFAAGKLRSPNTPHWKLKSRVGESRIANSGLRMTIIVYRRYEDIDVEFEDGTIVQHKTYDCFKTGSIRYPTGDSQRYNPSVRADRLGEEGVACNGMKMKIVRYGSCDDIDIMMEDGILLKHRTYFQFKNGDIGISDYKRQKHIGETKQTPYGQTMTIIEFNRRNDITVQFDDGTIVRHRYYGDFLKGYIRNPNITR